MMGVHRMKRILLAVALLLGAVNANAQDADDDYAAPEEQAAPESSGSGWDYDWSGAYIGANAGVVWGDHDTIGVGGIIASDSGLSGSEYGLHVGTNHQFATVVFGSELDFASADISGDFSLPGSLVACTGAFACDTQVNWHGSLRGRAGLAFNSFLPYVTGGLAVAGVETNYNGPALNQSVDGYSVGWVLGAGLEYAVMKHLVVRGEALHYELSDVSDSVLGTDVSSDPAFTVVRVGASVKF
jgi:outer membrane immunogenic protein